MKEKKKELETKQKDAMAGSARIAARGFNTLNKMPEPYEVKTVGTGGVIYI